MNKMILVVLGLVLALSGAGVGLAAPGQAQTVCPVLGGKINKDVHTDYKGQRVYFCCAGCDKEFHQSPDKYLKKMTDQGVTPEKRPGGK